MARNNRTQSVDTGSKLDTIHIRIPAYLSRYLTIVCLDKGASRSEYFLGLLEKDYKDAPSRLKQILGLLGNEMDE